MNSQAVKLLLPKEHGSWALVAEPLALGLLVAPSAAGGALTVAALAGFFSRRPLELALNSKLDPRRSLALDCVTGLAALAFASLLLVMKLGGTTRLWPLVPAVIAGLAFIWFDLHNEARAEIAELAGAIAFALLPAAFGALAGWNVMESSALALVMLARAVPTVMFVRTYLRLNKGRVAAVVPVFLAAGAGLFLTAWLVLLHMAPWPATVFALLMTAQTILLLVPPRLRLTAKTVGIAEVTLGAAMVLTLAFTWKNY